MDFDERLDLVIERPLAASAAQLWRAWSEPALLQRWWCPRPWTTELLAFDLRAGGAFHPRMHGPAPEGGVSDNPGCFLLVDPGRAVVFTTALWGGWQPPATPPWLAITAECSWRAAADGGTVYRALCRHRDGDERDRHAQMGFEEGWGACIVQLDEVARSLA